MTHILPDLPYDYNALEPYLDAKTMEIHHDKHHRAYVDKLNAALEKFPNFSEKSAEELITDLEALPGEIKTAVRNHGGGHVNHSLFWEILKKEVAISGEIKKAIESDLGGLEKFKDSFSQAAIGQFGSGWAWIVVHNGELEIVATANQDSPLTDGKTPILGIDVWEHAYYLKYQNRRTEYVENFFNIINWDKVNELYLKAR